MTEAKTVANTPRNRKSFTTAVTFGVWRISCRAMSVPYDTGLTWSEARSQSGIWLVGKSALLPKRRGRFRRFMIAICVSADITCDEGS